MEKEKEKEKNEDGGEPVAGLATASIAPAARRARVETCILSGKATI